MVWKIAALAIVASLVVLIFLGNTQHQRVNFSGHHTAGPAKPGRLPL